MRTMSIFDVHALPPAEVWAEVARQMQKGVLISGLGSGVRIGSVRDLEAYSTPVELDGRQLRYAIMHDVTERNEAVDALVRSEAALQRSQAGGAHRALDLGHTQQHRHLVGRDEAYLWPGSRNLRR